MKKKRNSGDSSKVMEQKKKKKKRNSGDSSKVVSYMPLQNAVLQQNAFAAELSRHIQSPSPKKRQSSKCDFITNSCSNLKADLGGIWPTAQHASSFLFLLSGKSFSCKNIRSFRRFKSS